jgi:hypothetical protein
MAKKTMIGGFNIGVGREIVIKSILKLVMKCFTIRVISTVHGARSVFCGYSFSQEAQTFP